MTTQNQNHNSAFLGTNQYQQIRSDLNTALKLDFAISSDFHHELKEYKLVYWSASFLYQKILICQESKKYYIERNALQYQLSLINCDKVALYDIARNDPDRQIRISFRQARNQWNLPAYGLIKLPAKFKGSCKPLRFESI